MIRTVLTGLGIVALWALGCFFAAHVIMWMVLGPNYGS